MNELLKWFNRYNAREQALLAGGAVLLLIYLLYLLLWSPLSAAQQRLQVQNERDREALVKVKVLAAQFKQLQSIGVAEQPGSNLSLSQIVDQTVATNQLAMKRYQPASDGDAQVRFENMPFNNLLAWLNQMESDYGLVVKDLAISPGSSTGLVNLSVRLSRSA